MNLISIIICTHNRADILREALAALEQVLPKDDPSLEVIVVDNGSTDATPQVIDDFGAKRPGVLHLYEPRPNKALALNAAGQAAKGTILVWIDDDVFPQPNWLENLVKPIVDDQADAVVGRITLAPNLLRDWLTPKLRQRMAEIPPPDFGDPFLVGANMAVRRSFYDRTGGFDPRLGPGKGALGFQDDSMLGLLLTVLKARIGFADQAGVVHHFDPSRLQRLSWLQGAEKLGRSCAYVSHHWYHSNTTFPRLRRWRKQVQLMFWRKKHLSIADPKQEGINADELEFVQQIAFLDQMHIEAHKPRNYEKCGLRVNMPEPS
jgi:glycosyltransferase involved in cell wall biosynthesis